MPKSYEEQANDFMTWVSEHYTEQKGKLEKWAANRGQQYSEDIWHDAIMKVYDKILSSGMNDPSPAGFDNYLFRTFTINTKREQQYARVRKRADVDEGTLFSKYEQSLSSENEKIMNDLRLDFTIYYLLAKVRENFSTMDAHFAALKYVLGMKVKDIKAKYPNEKNVKQRLTTINKWCRDNVSREEVEKAFQRTFFDN